MKKVVRYSLAIVAIILYVIIWVILAETLQLIQGSNSQYNKPYFLTYAVSYGFVMAIFPWLLFNTVLWKLKKKPKFLTRSDLLVIKVAIFLCPIFFLCGWTWYYSLAYTSVSANTAIYNSSFLFVLVFSFFVLKEKLSFLKMISCLICLIGILLVSFTSQQNTDSTVTQTSWGYWNVVFSTITFALYSVFYKFFVDLPSDPQSKSRSKDLNIQSINEAFGHEEPAVVPILTSECSTEEPKEKKEESKIEMAMETLLFTGAIGIATLILLWPGILILNYFSWEVFEWPTKTVWESILLNGFIDAVSCPLDLFAVMLTNPFFVSVGCLLSIPASVVVDMFINGYLLPPLAFLGLIMIVVGFILSSVAEMLPPPSKPSNPGHYTVFSSCLYRVFNQSCGLRHSVFDRFQTIFL